MMPLNPALLKLIAKGAAKYQAAPEEARGIIPLGNDTGFTPYDHAAMTVAHTISDALVGPAISVCDLAYMIVNEVCEIMNVDPDVAMDDS